MSSPSMAAGRPAMPAIFEGPSLGFGPWRKRRCGMSSLAGSKPLSQGVSGEAVFRKVSLRLLPFLFLRARLGAAGAGFSPGIIYSLSDWFPARIRGRAVAQFMLGGVVASMAGNPLSGLILESMDQVGGLWGWQWVFLLEGLPAVAL